MGKSCRDFEDSSPSNSSGSSTSEDTTDDSSTDSCAAPRRKKGSKGDTRSDRIPENPSDPKASGSGKASAASAALSTLIRATLGVAGEEELVPAQEAAGQAEGGADRIEVGLLAVAAAAADGLVQERPNPAGSSGVSGLPAVAASND
jgi:hypothetical protein